MSRSQNEKARPRIRKLTRSSFDHSEAALLATYKKGVKKEIPISQTLHSAELSNLDTFKSNLSPIMQLSALLTTLLVCTTFTAALPTGIPFNEDLKTAIAQERAQERDLATSNSLSEEERAYQLPVEIATFRYKRSLDPAVVESQSLPGRQTWKGRVMLAGGSTEF